MIIISFIKKFICYYLRKFVLLVSCVLKDNGWLMSVVFIGNRWFFDFLRPFWYLFDTFSALLPPFWHLFNVWDASGTLGAPGTQFVNHVSLFWSVLRSIFTHFWRTPSKKNAIAPPCLARSWGHIFLGRVPACAFSEAPAHATVENATSKQASKQASKQELAVRYWGHKG